MKINIKKKILSLLLIFMTVVTMMPATTFESMADITTPEFGDWSGSGTSAEPYLIASKEDLEELATIVDGGDSFEGKFFKLTSDISGVTNVIGKMNTGCFKGNFDGNDKTVTLNVDATDTDNCNGLFSYNEGTIKNLNIDGTANCTNGEFPRAGSICGVNGQNGVIENCHNNASVFAGKNDAFTSYAGGICAANFGIILNCSNTGNVKATGNQINLGGICGDNSGANEDEIGKVNNSYNFGNISIEGNNFSSVNIGGISATYGQGEFVNCYSCGTIDNGFNASNKYIGGLIGYGENVTVYNCFYDNSKTEKGLGKDEEIVGCTGLKTEQMKVASGATYTGAGSELDGKALVDLLNSYKGTGAGYPENWFTWEIKNDGEYPTFGALPTPKEKTAEPLCFTAIKAKASITLSKKGNINDIPFEYSTDGTSWEPYTLGSKVVMSAVGDKVYFRSTSTETKPLAKSDDIRYNFSTTGLLESIIVSGDATTMLNKNGTDTIPDYGLTGLFRGCDGLKSISPGLLPATKLGKYCYKRMFYYCINLSEIPEGLLPATTPKEGCYESMFEFCPRLTVDKIPPSLFIFQGTLPNRTYASMFKDCTRIMLSETPGNEYSIPFRFPADGTASNTNALNDMFTGTDGTFTGAPSLNTTYYGYKDEPEVPGDSTIKNELCLTALEANTTLALYKTGEPEVLTFKYLVNDGVWTDYTIGEPINLANPGDKVYFKSTTGVNRAIATATSDYYSFYVDSGSISASGDATTMLNKNGTDHIPTSGLTGLFRNCTRLKSISGGLLPATELGESAYNRMFYRCGLTEIPGNLLPATTSVINCYYEMFAKCTGLTIDKVPNSLFIFNGTLAYQAYANMFNGCSGIKLSETSGDGYTIPFRIPETGDLGNQAYGPIDMFKDTGGTWKGTPTLGKTYYGYKESENTAEPLCFTALEDNTKIKLNTSKYNPVTLEYSTNGKNWTAYTTDAEITLSSAGDKLYFRNTKGTDQPFTSCSFTISSGTVGVSGDSTALINKNGTDTLPEYCFDSLFKGCTGIKTISEGLLPATNLGDGCYGDMFRGCTGLTEIPAGLLPATTLTSNCYNGMFSGCTGLTEIPAGFLPATTLATGCYYNMFQNCYGLTIEGVPNSLFHVTGQLPDECYMQMFAGCGGIKLSETQSGNYSIPFRIPVSGTATAGEDSLNAMFAESGSDFGDAEANKTYYGYKESENTAEPLCFTALEDNTKVNFKKSGSADAISLEYSTNGTSWLPYTIDTEITLTSKGDKLYFRSTSTETKALGHNLDGDYHYHKFAVNSGSISASGDATTLLNKNGTDTVPDYAFFALFINCKGLKSISPGLLPATKLGRACYDSMFIMCSGLESIPAGLLPATELEEKCYDSMFRGCTSLKSIPEGLLPATTMAKECYSALFHACSGIESIPQGLLPATTLAEGCYSDMFKSCTGLTIEDIPNSLFHVTGTLPVNCYNSMFYNCTGIKLSTEQTDDYTIPFRVPVNGNATDESGHSVHNMFSSTGGTFTGSPALNTTYYGYKAKAAEPLCLTAKEANTKIKLTTYGDPDAVSLEYSTDKTNWNDYTIDNVITLPTNGSKVYLRNKSRTGKSFSTSYEDFYHFEIESGSIGASGTAASLISKSEIDKVPDYALLGLFNMCQGLKSISEDLLPTTELGKYCYYDMFYNSGLTSIPEKLLPAKNLEEACYGGMFAFCLNLTTLPAKLLPATTLADECYFGFCMNCTGLTSIPEGFLPATTLAKGCYQSMFESCEGLTMDGIPNSLFHVTGTLPDKCYDGMFEDCTGIKLSETKTGLYVTPFTVPVSGDATAGEDSLADMFEGTSGTFKGTPVTGKTYYAIKKLTMTPAGKSLSIKDELFVTFCFNLPEEFLETGKMIFTINNGGTQTVDGYMEKGLAKFKCKINVNQMNDAITWEFRVADQRVRSIDQAKSGDQKYSFYTYLTSATNEKNTKDYPDNAALCNTLKAYGYYAQHYLSEVNGNPIKPNHVELKKPSIVPTSYTEDLKKFKLEATGSSTNISADGITRSLILDSMISMKLYIPLKKSCEWTDATLPKITVKRDNTELAVLDAKIEDGQLCITTSGIAIKFLERTLTVQIGDEYTIKTTAMSYAQKLSELDSVNAVKLADSLYELCEKANGR